MQPGRANESRLDAGRRHKRQVADELDRVAEAVVVQHEHALAWTPRPPPSRKSCAERLGERFAVKPARLVSFEAAFEIAERKQKAAFPGDGLAAAERLGRLERRERLLEPPEIAQRQGLAAQGRGEIGARSACPAIGGERLLDAVELQKRVAEVDRGLGEVGPESESAFGGFERFLEASQLAQRAGATRPGVGVAGRKRCRRLERCERLVEPAHVEQELAQVDVGDDQRRVEFESLPIEAQRRFGLAALAQHVAAHAQGLGEIGPAAHRLVEAGDRLAASPFAPGSAGGQVKCDGLIVGSSSWRRIWLAHGARPSDAVLARDFRQTCLRLPAERKLLQARHQRGGEHGSRSAGESVQRRADRLTVRLDDVARIVDAADAFELELFDDTVSEVVAPEPGP